MLQPRKRTLTRTLSTFMAATLLAGMTSAYSPAAVAAPSHIDDSTSGSLSPLTSDDQPEPVPSAGCGAEQTPGNDEYSLDSAGEERTYRLNIPRSYEESTPTPLVLGFHGNGSDGAEFQNYTGMTKLPAVTAFPDGVAADGKRSWQGAPYASGADDLQFVSDLLDSIEDGYCIDLNRVYATGKSNGGGLVSLLSCQMRDRFSAFATVAGAYYPQSVEGCNFDVPTPMLTIHGTGDETMHYEGGERQGETYQGVRDWLEPWADASSCGPSVDRQVGRKGEDVVHTIWENCPVDLYSVADGGHVWPGEDMYSGGGYATEDFSATETAWKFFMDNPATNQPEPSRL